MEVEGEHRMKRVSECILSVSNVIELTGRRWKGLRAAGEMDDGQYVVH
jgi:hypothetical protein